jgi:hypothetical protein
MTSIGTLQGIYNSLLLTQHHKVELNLFPIFCFSDPTCVHVSLESLSCKVEIIFWFLDPNV